MELQTSGSGEACDCSTLQDRANQQRQTEYSRHSWGGTGLVPDGVILALLHRQGYLSKQT